MNTRNTAGAYLTCGNKILLMHRGLHRTLAPGMWSPVGGHLEPDELNDPASACLREIAEETGITAEAISDFRLRYMTVRHTGEEIRVMYYFTGTLEKECPLIETAEGTLRWVGLDEVPGLPMTYSVGQVTSHWRSAPEYGRVMLCAVGKDNESAVWCQL